MIEKKALGRGLGALIQQTEVQSASGVNEAVINIPISQIKANRYQPRTSFDQQKLDELVNSIKEKGVVQPVLVRKASSGGYELVAGERRLRAVSAAGSQTIPAIVKNVDDLGMLELSLIENIQREQLNPIEEAQAYQRFITEFKFTQEKISKVIGKHYATVSNTMRLLSLPAKIQDHVSKGELTAGHARAVLSLPTDTERLRLATLIVKKGLSVREAEAIAARRALGAPAKRTARADQNMADIENSLARLLGTRVKIHHGKKRGNIRIEYYSSEDLNRILDLITAASRKDAV